MSMEEDDIEKTRRQDQSLAGKARREAAEREQALKLFSEKALQAKKAKDARAFASLLRLQNVSENSEEWTNAWKFFYS
jgi:plasmid replication initiation protein